MKQKLITSTASFRTGTQKSFIHYKHGKHFTAVYRYVNFGMMAEYRHTSPLSEYVTTMKLRASVYKTGVRFLAWAGIFFFATTMSRPTLGPGQFSI
jgi:hypothetical protein